MYVCVNATTLQIPCTCYLVIKRILSYYIRARPILYAMIMASTDGKILGNAAYYSAVVSGLAMGYARLGKMAMGGAAPKLEFISRNVGLVVLDVGLAKATKDMLVKQGIIPADILK